MSRYPGRGRGLLPEQLGQFDHALGAGVGIGENFGAAALRNEELALANALPAFKTQGWSNSCVGHGIDSAAEVRLRVQGFNVPPGSPRALYTLSCMLHRRSKDEPLVDEGTYARVAMKAAADWGVPPEAEWPLWNPDGSMNDVTAEVPPDVLQRASSWKLKEQYIVHHLSAQARIDACCVALSKRYPLPIAAAVDDAFMGYNGQGVLTRPDPNRIVGGHMMCMIGYRTNSAGRREFLILNSWAQWGLSGSLAWVDEAWVLALWEIYAFTITKYPGWVRVAGVEQPSRGLAGASALGPADGAPDSGSYPPFVAAGELPEGGEGGPTA